MNTARDKRRLRPRRDDASDKPLPKDAAGRVPPHDLDAEGAVLSAMLLDKGALEAAGGVLKPAHFYSDANARIFEAAMAVASSGNPVDLVTVASWLRDREALEKCGGTPYLAQIVDATPAIGHVDAHARTVYEKWRLRSLIATCQRVSAEGYGDVGSVQGFIDKAEQDVYGIAHAANDNRGMELVGNLMAARFQALVAAVENGGEREARGISTGYDQLDELISGLKAGDLLIVAGRPGMGKTAFATCVGVNVATPRKVRLLDKESRQDIWVDAPGFGVCLFSYEMPKEQMVDRMMCTEGRVDLGKFRKLQLQSDDWNGLADAGRYLQSLPLWVDDGQTSLLELRAKVRRIQAEYNRPATDTQPERKVGVVIVDYLQLMPAPDHIESREQQISYLSRGLKQAAKELGVAVIALSQLNRSVETRSTKDKRPQLSDLRESGAIEQDADTIIFVYRNEYYFPDDSKTKGFAELIIAKQRNGPPGKVFTKFVGKCTRFENLAPGDYPVDADE